LKILSLCWIGDDMNNTLKLFAGFAMGLATAVMANIAPMIVPAMLAVIAAAVIIDSLGINKQA